ncbi:MAG TPA: hypothetical protein ENJ39_02085 [Flammeovirgaceae bacterium]|nr:hypothetical protein [Flammeovirgaceae bacterium]
MPIFNFRQSFYLVPVYFLALAVSPNFGADMLGATLFLIYPVVLPVGHYLAAGRMALLSGSRSDLLRVVDLLVFGVGVGLLFIAWQQGFTILLLLLVFLVLLWLLCRQRPLHQLWYITGLMAGMTLFYLQYALLNGYTFNRLTNTALLLSAMVAGYWLVVSVFVRYLTTSPAHPDTLRMLIYHYLLMVTGMLLFLLARGHLIYLPELLLAWLPAFTWLWWRTRQGVNSSLLHITHSLATLGLTAWLVWYFLDTTQVLQAIRGGF